GERLVTVLHEDVEGLLLREVAIPLDVRKRRAGKKRLRIAIEKYLPTAGAKGTIVKQPWQVRQLRQQRVVDEQRVHEEPALHAVAARTVRQTAHEAPAAARRRNNAEVGALVQRVDDQIAQ